MFLRRYPSDVISRTCVIEHTDDDGVETKHHSSIVVRGVGGFLMGDVIPKGEDQFFYKHVYLSAISDRRYDLQTMTHREEFTNSSTWSDVITNLMQLAEGSRAQWDSVVPEVDADYLLPDFRLLNSLRGRCSLGVLIDLVLHSVGMRACMVISPDTSENAHPGYGRDHRSTWTIQKLTDAKEILDENMSQEYIPHVAGQQPYRGWSNNEGDKQRTVETYVDITLWHEINDNFVHVKDNLIENQSTEYQSSGLPELKIYRDVFSTALNNGDQLNVPLPALARRFTLDENERKYANYNMTFLCPWTWKTTAFDDAVTFWHARESDFSDLDLGSDPGVFLMRISSMPRHVVTSVQLSRWDQTSFTMDHGFIGLTGVGGIGANSGSSAVDEPVQAQKVVYGTISNIVDDQGNDVKPDVYNTTETAVGASRDCFVSLGTDNNWYVTVEACP